jgi:CxxC-x17-CxxC domain-containing protein
MPPPLPPRAHPDDLRSRLRSGGGYADRGPPRGGYRNDRYSPYGDVRGERRQAPPTLKGWSPSGNTRDDGKDTFAGKCEGCGNDCEVPFRPVKGGNPPVCNDCHQSLRSAQGGPDRGKRGRDPYGARRADATSERASERPEIEIDRAIYRSIDPIAILVTGPHTTPLAW